MKNRKIFVILIATVVMFSMMMATAYATNTQKADTTDDSSINVLSKAKTVSYKITWNANGGKIGTKKTTVSTVRKGSKLSKFATTPKRSGYTFKGWYNQKSGGTKISKDTKPKKNVTYFAQWTKKLSTSTNSKIAGNWKYNIYNNYILHYYFFKNGTFRYVSNDQSRLGGLEIKEGNYKVSNGKIYLTNILTRTGTNSEPYHDTVFEYKFGKDASEYLLIGNFQLDKSYIPLSFSYKFRIM